MEAFLISTGIVALAEIGDKTQLLSFILAAKYRKPWPIVLGILVATLVNHALAGAVGAWLMRLIGPDAMRWILGLGFIAMAAWMLVPDKIDEDEANAGSGAKFGVFGTTVIAFFLAEMGDKTQIATVMLAAQYSGWLWVVVGTTLGMMLANAPVVWFGEPSVMDRRLVAQSGLNVGRLARDFRTLLATPAPDDWTSGQEEQGRIDGRRLSQLVANPAERRLFRDEHWQPKAQCVVSLLLDCSGSMKRHNEPLAALVDMLARALEEAGVGVEVLGFTTASCNRDNSICRSGFSCTNNSTACISAADNSLSTYSRKKVS